ncbi:M20/M25/M40 family metallo-hydrolase [Enterobacteriaceae bacterium LUAb1]
MNQLLERFFEYTAFQPPRRRGRRLAASRLREQQLAKTLYQQLISLGLQEPCLSKEGAVSGWLPGNIHRPAPALGFIALLQTDDKMPESTVTPQLIEKYRGGDIALGGGEAILSPVHYPLLHQLYGQTVITGDGEGALGCEATSGIAVIVTFLTELKRQKLLHGDIHVVFAPAGERGRNALIRMSQREIAVDYAWVISGGVPGELSWENQNIAELALTVSSPGAITAKSALHVALKMQQTWENSEANRGDLPLGGLTQCYGDEYQAVLHYQLAHHETHFIGCYFDALQSFCQRWQKCIVPEVRMTYATSYLVHNMAPLNISYPAVIDLTQQAIAAQGLPVVPSSAHKESLSIVLATAGIPCIQLCCGGYNLRTSHEFITLEAMKQSVNVLMHITKQSVRLAVRTMAS